MQQHITLERWTRGSSPVHRWDARTKVPALLLAIGFISATPPGDLRRLGVYAGLLLITILCSSLPAPAVLLRAAVVLPFSAAFSLISYLSGDVARAVSLPLKSYLSCLAVLLIVGTTPLPSILRAMDSFRAPRYVIFVVQFVYRYLFVLFEEAYAMRRAAQCRGGGTRRNRSVFQAAAGTLAVLFGKSYDRAEGIHHAMLSRGFQGHILLLEQPALTITDMLALFVTAALLIAAWMVV